MSGRGPASGEDREGGQEAGRPEVGSVAEEAAKLFGALNDWATQSGVSDAGTAAQHLAEGIRSAGEHVGHGEDCRYCPLCRVIKLARDTSPEVREQLSLGATALLQAASLYLADKAGGQAPEEEGTSVEKIDLDADVDEGGA
jgi:hypothetical protein